MKTFAIASIIALASVASAQLDNIPSCALTCFITPLSSDGCAALTDFKCHCQKGAQLLSSVQPCVKSGCSASDEQATIAAVEKTCKDAGAPIQIPNPSGAASSAAAVVSSAAGAASSAAAPVVSSAAGAVSSAASAASSAAGAKSSLASKASSLAASATGNATVPVKPSTSPSQFTGGAPQATAVGLLGAAALAMLAL